MEQNKSPETLFIEIIESIKNTNALYKKLFIPNLVVPAIPFFGNISTAKIITVGINPAASEFHTSRNWPGKIEQNYLLDRLTNYFNFPGVSPHNWFNEWEKTVSYLGVSYRSGQVAHIDLSPRVTINQSEVSDWACWEDMIAHDLQYFISLLNYCKEAKLILLAGAVSKKYYANEFVNLHCNKYGGKLLGSFKRREHPGKGKTFSHSLVSNSLEFPVFFCSISPSARNSFLLPERILANQAKLREYL